MSIQESIDYVIKNKSNISRYKEKGDKYLYLLSLGITATVLAYDLAKMNIWALDLGHFTNHYLHVIGKMEQVDFLRLEGKYIDGETDINNFIKK